VSSWTPQSRASVAVRRKGNDVNEGPEWFAAKRYGIGFTLPIAWQGWLVLLGYIAIVCAAPWLFAPRIYLALSIIVPATVLLLVIAARTTRGGWRWRWGDSD
jgi:hypothetical protein